MKDYDAVVVGGGPAGLAAAIRAAKAGAAVAVVESGAAPGGQLVKQIHKFFGSAKVCAGVRGIRLAGQLYDEAAENGCTFLFGHTVYDIEPLEAGGYRLFCANGTATLPLDSRTVILATGASENALAFPGWTLPGVVTAGAAQTLVNLHRVRFAKRVLMVGAGNVGLIVSHQLLQAGIGVAAVIEASRRVGGYEVHAAKIRRAGVPVRCGYTILEAKGTDKVEQAVIARLDEGFSPIPGTEETLEVDTVCLAVGLSPLVKLAQICGCETATGANGKNEVVIRTGEDMRTSLPGVFAAGDAAGVEEASIAMEEGALAGIGAAVYLGLKTAEDAAREATSHQGHIAAIRREGAYNAPQTSLDLYEGCSSPKAFIECPQEIPCNPCEAHCPVGAITIGDDLCATPRVDLDKCIGCGKCVAHCPGQACMMLNLNHGDGTGEVCVPYEYLPLPQKGDTLTALDADGQPVCPATVNRIQTTAEYDGTYVLRLLVPRRFAGAVRGAAAPCASAAGQGAQGKGGAST